MKVKVVFFLSFYFCQQDALTIPFYDFDFGFLKIILSIHSIQKIDKKQQETQKQDGRCQKIQGSKQKKSS